VPGGPFAAPWCGNVADGLKSTIEAIRAEGITSANGIAAEQLCRLLPGVDGTDASLLKPKQERSVTGQPI